MGNYLALTVKNVNWDNAHITLLHYGSGGPSVEQAKSHLKGYTNLNWFVQNMGTDLFGPRNDVPVSVVPTTVIRPIRNAIQTIMHELGHFESNKYEWTPHVTLPAVSTVHVPYLFKVGNLYLHRDGENHVI